MKWTAPIEGFFALHEMVSSNGYFNKPAVPTPQRRGVRPRPDLTLCRVGIAALLPPESVEQQRVRRATARMAFDFARAVPLHSDPCHSPQKHSTCSEPREINTYSWHIPRQQAASSTSNASRLHTTCIHQTLTWPV